MHVLRYDCFIINSIHTVVAVLTNMNSRIIQFNQLRATIDESTVMPRDIATNPICKTGKNAFPARKRHSSQNDGERKYHFEQNFHV